MSFWEILGIITLMWFGVASWTNYQIGIMFLQEIRLPVQNMLTILGLIVQHNWWDLHEHLMSRESSLW